METPDSFTEVFAAATDDLMIFSNGPEDTAGAAGRQIGQVFEARGIRPSTHKAIDDSLSGECVGVQLEEGVRLGVSAGRVAGLLWSALRTLLNPAISTKELEVLLGSLQWYHLLRRPLLAGLNQVYRDLHAPGPVRAGPLPDAVLQELGCAMLLGCFWTVDLCKPYAGLLGACDASTSFGFGGCVSAFPTDLVPKLARWCEKAGAYAVIDGVDDEESKRRIGARLELEVSLANFRDVLCVRLHHEKHINILESEGLLLWLRWYTRSQAHQNSRVVVLIDSTVVAQAAAKGRSSSSIGSCPEATLSIGAGYWDHSFSADRAFRAQSF